MKMIFIKTIKDKFNIKFIDTFRFMSEFLSSLAYNSSEDKTRFRETLKIFSLSTLNLVTQKGMKIMRMLISDLYLATDVCLLSDVFEKFRDLCLQTLKLDASHFITAPGFAFDCMLKHTNNGLRGGICHSVKRHVKANIPNIQKINYDSNKPVTWLAYLDC
ncbi:DNA pol B 2 domain-containing protein, partial [Aphis craccivora]